MDFDNFRGERYPDVYYTGDGRSYVMGDTRVHDYGSRQKGPQFQNYGYDRRKIPKPPPISPKLSPHGDGFGPRTKYIPRGYTEENSYPSLPRDEYKQPRQNGYPREPRHYRDRSRSSDGDYRHDSRERDYFRPPYGDPVRSTWDERSPKYPSEYGTGSWPGDQYDTYPRNESRDRRGLINGSRKAGDDRGTVYPHPTRILFLLIGILLIMIGISKVLFAKWNHFYATIWSGFTVALVGVVGLMHGRNYHSKYKNVCYILFGVFASLAVFVASALHVATVVPIIASMALQQGIDTVVNENATTLLKLTKTDHAAFTYDLQTQIYVSLGLDVGALILLCAANYVLTAVGCVMSRYSDARWGVYAECNPSPHKRPTFFNPFDQISMGQFAIFVGFVAEFVIISTSPERTTYWSPVWVGVVVIVAGFVSALADKWPQNLSRGVGALIMEFMAFLACIAALAVCTMGLYNEIVPFMKIDTNNGTLLGKSIATLAAFSLAIASLVINFLFICGSVIRDMWQLCCKKYAS